MTHVSKLAVVSAVLLVVSVARLGGYVSPSYASTMPGMDFAVSQCPLHCDNCNSEHTYHLTHYVGGKGVGGVEHEDCFPGSCNVHTCGDAEEEEEESTDSDLSFVSAWDAFRSASADMLGEVVRMHPQYFHVNQDRQALQVLNCGGEVFAHIPLSGANWERLIESLQVYIVE